MRRREQSEHCVALQCWHQLRDEKRVQQVVHEEAQDLEVLHTEGCHPRTRALRPDDPRQQLEKQVSRGPGPQEPQNCYACLPDHPAVPPNG
ncbi:Hypothetical protein SMAX5B_004873 [Scophthalmus maximus]|uniref:Uncharacterized protein n=1 Tax=Scophthalmus maximus TaxID=52904 RepID=A0A2U9B9K6_SCOMX|nr:Hypothetical protein SMAX5B_004873 [Scophthalmus maximus]